LIKTDGQGNEVWSRTFGGSGYDKGYSVMQAADGGYVIAGWTSSYGAGGFDVYLIKTDESGNEVWSQTFGGIYNDGGWSLQQTAEGGYIIAGQTESYGAGSDDVYLIKTDGQGNEVWSQTFGGNYSDAAYGMQQTADGGYIIGGGTYSYGGGGWDVYLIKTDGQGNEVWSQTFGGSSDDWGYSVQQTTEGGYIITGRTASYGTGSEDVYLIKTDESGNEVWLQTFGGSGNDYGESVRQIADGGYFIAGVAESYGTGGFNVYLIKTDESGNEVWSQTFGGSSEAVPVEPSRPKSRDLPGNFCLHSAHPNPFNPTTTIRFDLPQASWLRLDVFDVAGRGVGSAQGRPLREGWMEAGSHEVTFDGSNLASGIYIYRLEAGGFHSSGKMVMLK